MKVNSMNELPGEKKQSIIFLIVLAVSLAGVLFFFLNIVVAVLKLLIAFAIKNYVMILVGLAAILILRRFFRKGGKK